MESAEAKIRLDAIEPYTKYMEELKHLKDLLRYAMNMAPPMIKKTEEVQDYVDGFKAGWIAYRQELKKLFP